VRELANWLLGWTIHALSVALMIGLSRKFSRNTLLLAVTILVLPSML
jgi:hypothetical protein